MSDYSIKKLADIPEGQLIKNTNFITESNGKLFKISQGDVTNKATMEKVLVFYGYPIAINESWSVENACNIYRNYDVCVFGDTYADPSHEVYEDTVNIFKRLKQISPQTRLVGYVPIGLHPDWPDSNLTMDELKNRVNQWENIGINGIFLDEFGYDYYVTRERQNEIVKYCKDKGLFVFANSWSIEYVFNPNVMEIDWMPGFDPNPNALPPLLDENDYYLYENLFYSTVESNGNLVLECASVWRINDVLHYYTEAKIDGKTYYEVYKTKICSLDGIPSTLDITHKNILQSISVIGAAILNITSVAFGDENWGASGYYHHWDVPSLDIYTGVLNGVTVQTKEYTTEDGDIDSFPNRWSANLNGHTYSIVFDIDNPDDKTWVDGKRYASVNGVMIENAWATIFDFQTDVRLAIEGSQQAKEVALQIKEDVDNVMPTLTEAEENIREVVAEAEKKIAEASEKLEAGLADLETLTAGFQYKTIQW